MEKKEKLSRLASLQKLKKRRNKISESEDEAEVKNASEIGNEIENAEVINVLKIIV